MIEAYFLFHHVATAGSHEGADTLLVYSVETRERAVCAEVQNANGSKLDRNADERYNERRSQ